MTPLNPTLLAHGNPGLRDDETDVHAARGILVACLISVPIWCGVLAVVSWWL